MEQLVSKICALVKSCGSIVLQADREGMDIDSKSGIANFVTEYDKMVQERLRIGLLSLCPQATFIGEEGAQTAFSAQGEFFIVDPIDGTTNFIKDYHISCISVAYVQDGVLTASVIYNPYLNEMYTAIRGKGAFCNEKPVSVSRQPLENGIVLFGTSPYNAELSKKSFEMAYDYCQKALDIRRSGAAVWDLCCIASGRAELFFELQLSPWDYAAGTLLVREAGGIVTTIDGGEITLDKPCSILARNM